MAMKQRKFLNLWLIIGWNKSGFGIGFRVDKFGCNLDLGWLWLAVEF